MKIYQYLPTGKLFDTHNSLREASRKTSIPYTTLWDNLNKGREVSGFKWTSKPLSLIESEKSFKEELENFEVKEEHTLPKILMLDVETLPLKGYFFKVWKENISQDQIISDWFCAVWAAKWLDSPETISASCTPEEIKTQDDKRIMGELWNLLDQADVVVSHNLRKFDQPRVLTRCLFHGFVPPSPYREIDTLEVARKQFAFTSNRLDAINKFLGLTRKIDTDFQLWADCMDGKKEAILKMEVYCIQDIKCLEEAYLKLRPYIRNHPNLDVFFDDGIPHCPHCGSTKITPVLDKYVYTQAVEYQMYRCECGAVSRAKKGNKFMYKKQISAIPR